MTSYQNRKRKHFYTFFAFIFTILFIPYITVQAQDALSDDELFLQEESFDTYGIVEGRGYEFKIEEGDYLTPTVVSTQEIQMRMESIPYMITIHLEEEKDTETTTLTFSGFESETDYYVYRDGYESLEEVKTDNDGIFTIVQDVVSAHLLFIQPRKSTIIIKDNATGGDCTQVGKWHPSSKTCELTHDVVESIEISDDGITLEGNGRTIHGYGPGTGILVFEQSDITIHNVFINNYSSLVAIYNSRNISVSDIDGTDGSTGILLVRSSNITAVDNIVRNARSSMSIYKVSDSTISRNVIEDIKITFGSGSGLKINESHHNIIEGNIVQDGKYGIYMDQSAANIFSRNTLIENDYGLYMRTNEDIPNQFVSNTIANNHLQDIFLKKESCNTIFTDTVGAGDHPIEVIGPSTESVIHTGGTYAQIILCSVGDVKVHDVEIAGDDESRGHGLDIVGRHSSVVIERLKVHRLLYGIYVNDIVGNLIVNNSNFVGNRIALNVNTTPQFVRIFHNNFHNNFRSYYGRWGQKDFQLWKDLPIGGNYWDTFDDVSEGCLDDDHNGFCDEAYENQQLFDRYPRTTPGEWGPGSGGTESQTIISFVDALGYGQDDDGDKGVEPNKGVADKTKMQFKVVVTDDDAQDIYTVDATPVNSETSEIFLVNLLQDTSAEEDLRDGDLSNGEQFVGEATFPKGEYEYSFHYKKNTETTRFPETEDLHFETGHSSVVFLPGIQASRLYKDGFAHEDRLWEPGLKLQLDDLMMDKGESVRDDIYTRDIIDEAYTELQGGNVYKKFELFMDDQVDEGVIKEWKALAYDWRLDLKDLIVRGSVMDTKNEKENVSYEEQTLTPYILDQMQKIADRSPSDHITIVAHSNGGLLAKYLLSVLQDENHPLHDELGMHKYYGLADRIDKIILVAVPQLGTPKGLEALLHGDASEMPREFGLIVDEKQLRQMSEEMTSAYNLMPSKHYFDIVEDPVIEFSDDVAEIYDFRDLYSEEIDNQRDLTAFLLGDDGAREEPDNGDVDSPNVLDEDLLDNSHDTHDILDDWEPVGDTEVIQIAGWGLKTLRGIKYDNCDIIGCPDKLSNLDREIKMTHVGDGTVVLPSAISMGNKQDVKTYYIDIRDYNAEGSILHFDENRNRSHASILEIPPLQEFLLNVMQGSDGIPSFIDSEKPDLDDGDIDLDFRLHSPVSIHLFDQNQLHTGLWNDEEYGGRFYEAEIPNSYYKEYGETKYSGGTSVRTVELIGQDLGTFTLEIDKSYGDDIIESVTFIDIPVTASTIAKMQISEDSIVGEMAIDVDGDGDDDMILSPNEVIDTLVQLQLLRKAIETIDMGHGARTAITQHLLKAEKSYEKGQTEQVKKSLEKVEHSIEIFSKESKQESQRIEGDDAEKLLEIIINIKNKVNYEKRQ